MKTPYTAAPKKMQSILRQAPRYTNLRDVRSVIFESRGFLDICWKAYDFSRHIETAQLVRPHITVARDIENIRDLDAILQEAELLKRYSDHVVLVPKDPKLSNHLERLIPKGYLLGYSCPTRYGYTPIPPERFTRPVHLLGGRPDIQRKLAEQMPVYSFDCNRFTIDAAYGDFFDGHRFRPLGQHDYEKCIRLSLGAINMLWRGYSRKDPP
jgi:hypothetical protein